MVAVIVPAVILPASIDRIFIFVIVASIIFDPVIVKLAIWVPVMVAD
jgi:hypothetical protein